MTTETKTISDIVTDALREADVVGWEFTPPEGEAERARVVLNRMLKSWQARESFDWLNTYTSHTPTATAAQTLNPVRPVRVMHVNLRRSGTDLPMTEMTRDEYDTLPNKSTQGTPTQWYYDRQKEAAVLYIWPILSTVSGETLEITYQREFADIADLDDVLDVPSEAFDAVVLNLAARLAGSNKQLTPRLEQSAFAAYQSLLSGQSTGSVWMGEAVE